MVWTSLSFVSNTSHPITILLGCFKIYMLKVHDFAHFRCSDERPFNRIKSNVLF